MTTNPIEKDAIDGPNLLEIFARVAAVTGEPDRHRCFTETTFDTVQWRNN